jgi:hypothetical protein
MNSLKIPTEPLDLSYMEEDEAIAGITDCVETLCRNLGAGAYDLEELDPNLYCEMWVGNISIFSVTNKPPFYFVSSKAARSCGFRTKREMMDLGGLNLMRRNFKKLECIYWVKRLLELPYQKEVKAFDYLAHVKVVKKDGGMGWELRRFFACNIRNFKGRHDIMSMGFEADDLVREYYAFRTAVHPDPRVRSKTAAVHRLCQGKRRLQVYQLRIKKKSPETIAEHMGISKAMVNEHLTEIYRILGLRGNKLAKLIHFAERAGHKWTLAASRAKP